MCDIGDAMMLLCIIDAVTVFVIYVVVFAFAVTLVSFIESLLQAYCVPIVCKLIGNDYKCQRNKSSLWLSGKSHGEREQSVRGEIVLNLRRDPAGASTVRW